MTTKYIQYGDISPLVATLASLADSATYITGREAEEFDNAVNKQEDLLLQGFLTTGTTPTVDTEMRVYVAGSDTSFVLTPRDILAGIDAGVTFTSVNNRDNFVKLAATVKVTAASDIKYPFGPVSLKSLFGSMPKFIAVFIANGTGVALNSTESNHEITISGIKSAES